MTAWDIFSVHPCMVRVCGWVGGLPRTTEELQINTNVNSANFFLFLTPFSNGVYTERKILASLGQDLVLFSLL